MVSRSLPFIHRPSLVSPHDSSSTGSFPRLFRSQISPHESSSTVSLPRLFRSHISTSIMTKNAPMQRKFNFGEDENHSFGAYRLTGRRRTTQTSGKEARMLSWPCSTCLSSQNNHMENLHISPGVSPPPARDKRQQQPGDSFSQSEYSLSWCFQTTTQAADDLNRFRPSINRAHLSQIGSSPLDSR